MFKGMVDADLRDYFASKALAAIIMVDRDPTITLGEQAGDAYRYADEMMKHRLVKTSEREPEPPDSKLINLMRALDEAISFFAEDRECLVGPDDPHETCPDPRCTDHGCMVARVNRWRALIPPAMVEIYKQG